MIHCPASGGGGLSLEKASAITIEPQMFTLAALLPHCSDSPEDSRTGRGLGNRSPAWPHLPEEKREPRAEAAARPWQHEELGHTITAGSPHSLCAM